MSQAPTDPIDRASAWTRSLGITRPSDEAWFAGVCAGIARRFNVDPILIRAGAVALAMLGGFGVVAYLALWLALPGSDSRILGEEAVRRGNVSGVLLLILLFLVLVGGLGWSADGGWRLWLVIPLGYLAYRILRRDGQTATPLTPPTPAPPPPGVAPMAAPTVTAELAERYAVHPGTPAGYAPAPHGYSPPTPPLAPVPPRPRRRRPSGFVGLISLGLATVAFGAAFAIARASSSTVEPLIAGTVAALTITSVVAIILGLRGMASGFTGFLVAGLLMMAPTVAVGLNLRDVSGGAGTRYWVPSSSLTQEYTLGAGDATLDLTPLAEHPLAGPAEIRVRAWAASVRIIVPANLDVTINARTDLGTVRDSTGDSVTSGSTSQTFTGAGPTLIVDADVSMGEIIIEYSGESQ